MPSSIAFGPNGNANGSIRPFSPVAYDITVTDIFTLESKHQENVDEIMQYLEEGPPRLRDRKARTYRVLAKRAPDLGLAFGGFTARPIFLPVAWGLS